LLLYALAGYMLYKATALNARSERGCGGGQPG